MTPHANARGGSLLIDLVFPPPVGRIARASGTTDPKLHARYVALLKDLWDVHGRADILQAIQRGPRRGGLTVQQVWAHRTNLSALPSAETLVPLATAWAQWVARAEGTSAHRERCARTGERLMAAAVPALGLRLASVHDLPALLEHVREARRLDGTARAWAYDKSNAQAFLRDTLGTDHRLYATVRAMKALPKTAKRAKRPLTVAEWDRLVPVLRAQPMRGRWTTTDDPNTVSPESAARAQEAVALCWTMLVTGMGPFELWGAWTVEPSHVHVAGTKRAGRVRDVPRWRPPAEYARPTAITRKALEQRFTAATAASIGRRTLYDLRRTFAVWCEDAGIAHSHIVRYMGHAAPTMTTLYQSRELRAELRTDGDKLVQWLQAQRRPQPLTLVSEGHVP